MSPPPRRERRLVGLAAGTGACALVLLLAASEAFRALERRTGDRLLALERTLSGGGIADSSIVIALRRSAASIVWRTFSTRALRSYCTYESTSSTESPSTTWSTE